MKKLYWAWPAHLLDGRIIYAEHKKYCDGMVRVRIEIVKCKKPKKRRK